MQATLRRLSSGCKRSDVGEQSTCKALSQIIFYRNQKSIKEKKVTARVGKQRLRVSDLNTLAPKTWLNDNIVDLTTQVLASRAITESRRVVAVFDSQFTKLILETPKQPTTAGTGMDYYIYEKVVGVAEKWLLGKSPDCPLFPNVINHNHRNIMAVSQNTD
jgi:hypothetical protein